MVGSLAFVSLVCRCCFCGGGLAWLARKHLKLHRDLTSLLLYRGGGQSNIESILMGEWRLRSVGSSGWFVSLVCRWRRRGGGVLEWLGVGVVGGRVIGGGVCWRRRGRGGVFGAVSLEWAWLEEAWSVAVSLEEAWSGAAWLEWAWSGAVSLEEVSLEAAWSGAVSLEWAVLVLQYLHRQKQH